MALPSPCAILLPALCCGNKKSQWQPTGWAGTLRRAVLAFFIVAPAKSRILRRAAGFAKQNEGESFKEKPRLDALAAKLVPAGAKPRGGRLFFISERCLEIKSAMWAVPAHGLLIILIPTKSSTTTH